MEDKYTLIEFSGQITVPVGMEERGREELRTWLTWLVNNAPDDISTFIEEREGEGFDVPEHLFIDDWRGEVAMLLRDDYPDYANEVGALSDEEAWDLRTHFPEPNDAVQSFRKVANMEQSSRTDSE